jgi:hypothetical protein
MIDPAVIVCLVFAALVFGAYAQTRVKSKSRELGFPVWLTTVGVAAIALVIVGVLAGQIWIGAAGLIVFGLAALLSLLISPKGVTKVEDVVIFGSIFAVSCYMCYRGFFYRGF